MKSRNKIIEKTRLLSGKSYKECRSFLKRISWDIEGNYFAYWSFIVSIDKITHYQPLEFPFESLKETMIKVSVGLTEAVERAKESLLRFVNSIPPEIADLLRKEAENEQRDDQVS